MVQGLRKAAHLWFGMLRETVMAVRMRPEIMVIGLMAGGCAAMPEPAPIAAKTVPIPTLSAKAGLDKVIGRTSAALTGVFGKPDADVTEGSARKLQFAGPICVLDAYLYGKGTAEPVVTHVDARQRDGSPIDQASCVQALTRRGRGK